MKKITLLLFVFFASWQLQAQTGTVVVGTDDGTPNTTFGDPSPLQDYWKVQRTQYLFLASELSGAGLVAGNITKIGWVATALNGSGLQEGYTIRIKSTTSSVLTTTFETGATVAYGPTDFTPTSTGNVLFTLTTPFNWDGTSNIIIELCAGLASGTYTTNVSCANATTTGNTTAYFRNDVEINPCTITTATTLTNQRPLLVVTGNVAGCLAPLNIVSSSPTATTASISWDAVTPTPTIGYQYVVSASNSAPTGSGTPTTSTFASITGLSPQTTYYVFVRSVCTGSQNSGWGGPSTFTTGCAPITIYPNLEPFVTFLPNQCWVQRSGGDLITGPTPGTSGAWSADGLGNNGFTGAANYNLWQTGGNDWLLTPQYAIPTSGYELKLIAAITNYAATTSPTNWDAGDFVQILVSTNGTTNWTPLFTYDVNNYGSVSPTGSLNVIDLDAYSGQTVRFAIRAIEGAAVRDIDFSFDNFEVRLSPTCPDVVGLAVGGITSSGANVSWDALTGVTGYQYAVVTSATSPTSGTATTSTFAVVTGLNPQTLYYLHVRAACAGGVFGNWSTISFTTNCANVTSFSQNFDTTTTPNFPTCWSKIGTGGSANTQGFNANTTPNVLYLASFSTTSLAVVATQQISNFGAGTNRIKFNMRGSFGVGGIIEFGYLTNPLDASTFVALTSFTASTATYTSYQYSPPAGTYSNFPAFRHTGVNTNGVLLDDVNWEQNPACPDQTGVVVGGITSSGANSSWDAINGAIGYEYIAITSATPPASGTPTTSTFAVLSGLNPQTIYYLHVRPMCAVGSYGLWATTSFTTACVPITSLPWTEGFEGLTAVGTNNFPPCWFEQNGEYATAVADTFNTPRTGLNYLRDNWSATNEFMWTPGFNLVAGTSYDFSSWVQGDGGTGWTVEYFVNMNQTSTGATQLGLTYNVPGSGTYAIQTYQQMTRSFIPTTSGTYYFATRVNQPSGAPWYVAFDDFELKLSPSCFPPTATVSNITPSTANLAWNTVPTATLGYQYVLNTTATTPTGAGTAITATTFSATGLTSATTYYFHIRSACSAGAFSTWATISFTTTCTNNNVPYVQNFETATVPGLPLCTVQQNVGTGNLWSVANNPGNGFTTKTLQYIYNSANAANVWFFTNGINLVAGTAYKISYDYGCNSSFYIERLKIAYGTSATAASMTNPLADHPNIINNVTPINNIVNFTPTTSGIYYFGFNAYSIANQFNLYVDNIIVDVALANDSFTNKNFSVYPNPVKDVLNINYIDNITNIQVINMLGQELMSKTVNATQNQIDLSQLPQGNYLVRVTANDVVKTIKIIKE